MERTELIANLRHLADFLEDNEAVPTPKYGFTINVMVDGKDELLRFARSVEGVVADDGGGSVSSYFTLRKKVGALNYDVYAAKENCGDDPAWRPDPELIAAIEDAKDEEDAEQGRSLAALDAEVQS